MKNNYERPTIKPVSNSASSHKYCSGDYSTVTEEEYEKDSIVSGNHRQKKTGYIVGAIIIVVFTIVGATSFFNSSTKKVTTKQANNELGTSESSTTLNPYIKEKAPAFIVAQQANMQKVTDAIEKILDDTYTKEYDSDDVNKYATFINYHPNDGTKNQLRSLSTYSIYDSDNLNRFDESIDMSFQEIKQFEGIKLDSRIKSLMLTLSPTLPFDTIVTEANKLYASVPSGSTANKQLVFGDTKVVIIADNTLTNKILLITLSKTIRNNK